MSGVMAGNWRLPLLQHLRPVVAHVVDLVADRADGVGAGMGWLRQLQEGLGRGVGIEPVVKALGVDDGGLAGVHGRQRRGGLGGQDGEGLDGLPALGPALPEAGEREG